MSHFDLLPPFMSCTIKSTIAVLYPGLIQPVKGGDSLDERAFRRLLSAAKLDGASRVVNLVELRGGRQVGDCPGVNVFDEVCMVAGEQLMYLLHLFLAAEVNREELMSLACLLQVYGSKFVIGGAEETPRCS